MHQGQALIGEPTVPQDARTAQSLYLVDDWLVIHPAFFLAVDVNTFREVFIFWRAFSFQHYMRQQFLPVGSAYQRHGDAHFFAHFNTLWSIGDHLSHVSSQPTAFKILEFQQHCRLG